MPDFRNPLVLILAWFACVWTAGTGGISAEDNQARYRWEEMPSIPDELGVAGPFAGVHNDALIVAGGANFPQPVWETSKVWRAGVYVLPLDNGEAQWNSAGNLERPIAYGAAVSTPFGVLCMGGNDGKETFDKVFLIRWRDGKLDFLPLADLPQPSAFGAATRIGNMVYLAGGQSGSGLETAGRNLWRLVLPSEDSASDQALKDCRWETLPEFPGPPRAFNLTVAQHNGFHDVVHVISGRRQQGGTVEFLRDNWEFDPERNRWRRRADAPRCVMAGTAASIGQSHVLVLGGADGSNFFRSDELKDRHPGFPREALQYHTITDSWCSAGEIPANHVTTIAVRWKNRIIVPSGEVRPRVRSPRVWAITLVNGETGFGAINYIVLIGYLVLVVGVGVWFTRRNRNTDQFFRGGKSLPWWAAGCSIFATMLSSLTYTGVPAKSFAQDWVYAVGNFMIPLVAFVAVFIALPFFRRIDATSAYEYLEKRFSRPVRLFGSASFGLFHIFRMAVVMSLTALALAAATPLTPVQSVLLMGALSILYCTLGGIEAVIWTDTLQTVVLLGGALVAVLVLLGGIENGWTGLVTTASQHGKFNLANLHWNATDAQLALWVVVVGGIGQNLSSYTADQAVVQRYMTTPDQKLAARSIWTNAVLAIPATLIFFGIGTALFVFYRQHPQRLDPGFTTDQIFPMFIANEMPVGLAGLLVAGIFAAAQSTVSTSINSTATTVVTDFLKPFLPNRTDKQFLRDARLLSVLLGVAGTAFALLFISPQIKSLFDEFIKVIGLFMGVLGGLFVLGVGTRRANATGAIVGAFGGAAFMFWLWKFTSVNGYIYTACGITVCFVIGYVTSLLVPGKRESRTTETDGLTIYDLRGGEKDHS